MKQYNHIDDEDKEQSLLINASQDTDFIPKVDSGGINNNKLVQHDNTSQCFIENNSNSFLDEINVTIDSIINDALPYDRKHLNKFLSSIKGHLKLLSAKINKNKIEIDIETNIIFNKILFSFINIFFNFILINSSILLQMC